MHRTTDVSSPAHSTAVKPSRERQRLLSVADTAWTLGRITEREVYRMLDREELKSIRIGRRRMVLVESIDAYIELRLQSAA